jgi:ubiquinone/menaquinone biosynthesis C-methylase UbiE
MTPEALSYYRSPETLSELNRSGDHLVSAEGHRFALEQGVPNLIWPPQLPDIEAKTKSEYDRVADKIYDAALNWQFAALYEEEDQTRELMLDMLDIKSHFRVLEIGCGTGRDSYRIARRLSEKGSLFLQDLSPGMVHTCVKRMAEYDREMNFKCAIEYSISSATYLPFQDNFFDSVFHFGGFNEFSDQKRAAAEFARVVKPGGNVLFGDESVGPWLRGTEFEGIVTTNNPLFRRPLPIDTLPVSAREVNVRWIMGNCFYIITFRKGDGPPPLNLDLPHAGWRGGTMRSRYFGVMEGVTPEAKEMARTAAAKAGLSIHEWLDQLVRKASAVTKK